MIIGRDISIEIGGRTLIRDGAFLVGRGRQGRPGGPQRRGEVVADLRSSWASRPATYGRVGDVRFEGTVGYLPQMPVPGGLGVDASALSHVLSARGLDVLDDRLHKARTAMAAVAHRRGHPRVHRARGAYRTAGGYEMEGQVARLADGLGLAQELLFEDVSSLSGGQRRRVDLMRVLFQAPDTMVLDEPTNHLDLAAKRWLVDELRSFPGALLVVSHDLRLLDEAITKVVYLSDHRLRPFKGTYYELPGPARRRHLPAGEVVGHGGRADPARCARRRTNGDTAPRPRPGRRRSSTAR